MSPRWWALRESGCKAGCRAIATACGSSMFVQAIDRRGIGGESGEKQGLCPSLFKHQQTSPRQRVEFAQGLAAPPPESDFPPLKPVIEAKPSFAAFFPAPFLILVFHR